MKRQLYEWTIELPVFFSSQLIIIVPKNNKRILKIESQIIEKNSLHVNIKL